MELQLNHITKSYGKTLALSDFSMTFDSGIYALLGPNGSGKSTLMNILTDNLKPDAGEIPWGGESTRQLGVRYREKIGFMPQYPGLYPAFKTEEFLWYMAALKGITKEAAKEQIPLLLEAVELSDAAKRRIGALSGGMKQRLALAQAMLGDPELIILDEPTAGLDPKQRIAIRNYISSIALHKIVLIATHVVSDIEFIAKNIILLKKGVIVDCDTAPELLKKIEKKVWNVRCRETDVGFFSEHLRIIGISKCTEDLVDLRVISDRKPTTHAVNVIPALEDYYLYTFADTESREVVHAASG